MKQILANGQVVISIARDSGMWVEDMVVVPAAYKKPVVVIKRAVAAK